MSPDAVRARNWIATAVARGLALFIGGLTLVGVIGSLRRPAADFAVWWIAVPGAGRWLSAVLLVLVGAALVGYAVAPRLQSWRRSATIAIVVLFAAVAAWNGAQFYLAWRDGGLRPALPAPLSFVVCAALAFVAWAALRPPERRRRAAAALLLVATTVACALLFPVAQVYFFGQTDYRRSADAVVVFGAQVYADGAMSTSLKDRMTTAISLYDDGLVGYIVVSGAVGDSGLDEAAVMRDAAVAAGVPVERVLVDSRGVNTGATVDDTVPLFDEHGWSRILAVSQFYHLPRIKLAYQQAGWDVLTVPAGTSAPIPETHYLVTREIPAFWLYYLRAVFG